jgi:hypothetical protein
MDLVYAYNLNTNRPGLYMPERTFWVLFKIFGRPEHWDFVGGVREARKWARIERDFWPSGRHHGA